MFINDYFDLSKRAKCSLGKEYDEVIDDKFMSVISGMREEIKVAKVLRQQLCEAVEKGKAQAAHDYERCSQIVKAENLISEIEFRCGSLQRKYEQKFEDLTDYQILDISQNKNLDLEFNEVLERITSLAAYVTVGRGDSQKLFDSAVANRDILAGKRMAFQGSLQKNNY